MHSRFSLTTKVILNDKETEVYVVEKPVSYSGEYEAILYADQKRIGSMKYYLQRKNVHVEWIQNETKGEGNKISFPLLEYAFKKSVSEGKEGRLTLHAKPEFLLVFHKWGFECEPSSFLQELSEKSKDVQKRELEKLDYQDMFLSDEIIKNKLKEFDLASDKKKDTLSSPKSLRP